MGFAERKSSQLLNPKQKKAHRLGEHYYHKVVPAVPAVVLKLAIYSLGQQKKLRYWPEILGISSNSPNLIFGSVMVNSTGFSN